MARREWADKETNELLRLYSRLDNEALSIHFDRTNLSIYKKARALGLYKNPEIEYINRSKAREGEKSSNWNGGRKKSKQGYVFILNKGHHRADRNGYVLEHIVIMEKHIGRLIGTDEVVHHKNGVKDDNRVENLEVMGFGEHTGLHGKGRKHSEETRKKISNKALQRFKDISNHPNYKQIDKDEFLKMLLEYGPTKTAKKLSICRRTAYNRIKQFEIEEMYKNVK